MVATPGQANPEQQGHTCCPKHVLRKLWNRVSWLGKYFSGCKCSCSGSPVSLKAVAKVSWGSPELPPMLPHSACWKQVKARLLTAELSFNLNHIAHVESFKRQHNSQGVLAGGRTEASSHGKLENQSLLHMITSFQQRGKSQLASATWNSLDQSFHTPGKVVQILGMRPAF